MSIEQMQALIKAELHNYERPEYKKLEQDEIKFCLDVAVKCADTLYGDTECSVNYHIDFLLSPNIGNYQYIEIKNVFQLYYILDIPLIAFKFHDDYVVYGIYRGYKFAEIVSEEVYQAIYKDISTFVTTHDIFFPGR